MRRLAPIAAVFVLVVVAAPAEATHGSNAFSGSWTTTIGASAGFPSTSGGVSFAVISEEEGAPALQSLAGQPCGVPTTYYRGFYYDANNTGAIIGCERSLGHLVGRYISDGSQRAQGDGSIDVTFARPNQFSGFITADEFPDYVPTYSGVFQSHVDGDGCCPETQPSQPGGPIGPAAPPPCPSSGLARMAQEVLDECYTLQKGPARGKVGTAKGPKVGGKTKSLTGTIGFVDDNGNPVAGPDIAAVHAHTDRAGDACFILLLGAREGDVEGPALQAFTGCVAVVARILARSDQIQKRRQANRSRAAARRCPIRVARGRNRQRVKPKLRVSCVRTASGVRFKIRARSRKRRLGKLLDGSRVKVRVGRSKLSPGGDVQLVALWTVSD